VKRGREITLFSRNEKVLNKGFPGVWVSSARSRSISFSTENWLHWIRVHFWDAANNVWVWKDLGQPHGATGAATRRWSSAIRGSGSALRLRPGQRRLPAHVPPDSGATTPVWVLLDM
jgi:hypothetical protein